MPATRKPAERSGRAADAVAVGAERRRCRAARRRRAFAIRRPRTRRRSWRAAVLSAPIATSARPSPLTSPAPSIAIPSRWPANAPPTANRYEAELREVDAPARRPADRERRARRGRAAERRRRVGADADVRRAVAVDVSDPVEPDHLPERRRARARRGAVDPRQRRARLADVDLRGAGLAGHDPDDAVVACAPASRPSCRRCWPSPRSRRGRRRQVADAGDRVAEVVVLRRVGRVDREAARRRARRGRASACSRERLASRRRRTRARAPRRCPTGRPGYSYAHAPTSTSSSPSPLTSAQPTPVPAKLPSCGPRAGSTGRRAGEVLAAERRPAERDVRGALPRVGGRDPAPLRRAGDDVVVAVAVDVARAARERAAGAVAAVALQARERLRRQRERHVEHRVRRPRPARGPRAARRPASRRRRSRCAAPRGGSRRRPGRTRPSPCSPLPPQGSCPSSRPRRRIANDAASAPASVDRADRQRPGAGVGEREDLRRRHAAARVANRAWPAPATSPAGSPRRTGSRAPARSPRSRSSWSWARRRSARTRPRPCTSPPGASVAALQVSAALLNWFAWPPESVTAPSVYAAASSLVIVTVCAVAGAGADPAGERQRARRGGEVAAGAGDARAGQRRPVGGDRSVVVRAPVAVGANATVTVQVWPCVERPCPRRRCRP